MKKCKWRLLAGLILLIPTVAFNQTAPDSVHKETVFLLHGLGRNNMSMWSLARKLEKAGFQVIRIGYPSIRRTPREILDTVRVQINRLLPKENQSVHFVGHSLGGLMIRAYLDSTRLPNLGRVVLIGTPNHGTPLVDKFRGHWWFNWLGAMTLALGTDSSSFAARLGQPYYPTGVIAAVSQGLPNESYLPGADDGLVPVASTVLNGMTDRILVHTNHAMMRYNNEVAEQTIYFLRHGAFLKKNPEPNRPPHSE